MIMPIITFRGCYIKKVDYCVHATTLRERVRGRNNSPQLCAIPVRTQSCLFKYFPYFVAAGMRYVFV